MRFTGKWLVAAVAILMLLPRTGWAFNTTTGGEFTDIAGHWAKPPIEKIHAIGLVKGFPDHTFRPNQPVSCLEAITVMLNAAGYSDQIAKLKRAKNAPPSPYPVPWGQNYMDFAVQQKFIPAAMLQNFQSHRAITRAELAAIIANTFYLTAPDAVGYTDGDSIPPDYLPAVQAVSKNGLMSGYPDGSFRPQGQVARGELAAILSKLYDQGWINLDPKRKITGWIARINQVKNGTEIELNSIYGTVKVLADANCKCYYQGQLMDLKQAVNYRVEGILDSRRRAAYLELLERRTFSPVRQEVYASYLRLAEGEPVVLTVKDLMNNEVDYPIAWDASVIDEKAKGKTTGKDLLKKLKVDQFVKLGVTSGGEVKDITILDVKTITGKVASLDRKLRLESKTSNSKKYVPDEFWGWDSGRLVDKDGEEISKIEVGDNVKIYYIGEPFYERVLQIQKQ
ncbi:S-layer domain-containing protein [Desulfotomaculum nigrificans CO-1-SRB]|uniref:S-layer domain-containing protein n=1 Tax=Desulfotomaculum nigrificans (strain DSM 14880 / VKM B-2319 / CO-1-SRB) TaxID=868595 RepID=F6B7M8_DESCC|nr:S-layer homology domain-containing protein [Desulfotomaculum nigrificans]AEF94582.1 S-layer domain-containing protein [Desulfotomaculum nigrificans CO-1-SRB]